jgi:hypothetical protein
MRIGRVSNAKTSFLAAVGDGARKGSVSPVTESSDGGYLQAVFDAAHPALQIRATDIRIPSAQV